MADLEEDQYMEAAMAQPMLPQSEQVWGRKSFADDRYLRPSTTTAPVATSSVIRVRDLPEFSQADKGRQFYLSAFIQSDR